MKHLYLILTLLGIALPYGAFLPWLVDNGINIGAFIDAILSNPISVFAWLDVVVSACTLIIFILVDGKRHQVRYRHLALLGTCTVGVSCGLPLYLYLKERQSQPES
ncbi:DUF2834 domain-containing protein [Oceanospirillum beijerinckii]|uniref:DUF2834 domain-containing protein n=1 Tax=Oceanospirillum beijerinckii TaxID=64976 RepID=UPI00040F4671|nr:DUF2834 domain-containing protein [Oceanospirillum beijerinckii]